MIIQSRAPNRILDFGGWTDTHFAQRGHVLNVAVSLFANVTIKTVARPGIAINVQDYGERLYIENAAAVGYDSHHDLLKAAIKIMGVGGGLEVMISADVPPGCGTGSSAAISVALINALGIASGEFLSAHEIARLAHRIGADELGCQCGLQGQYAAAYGGVNFIDMPAYPMVHVSPVPLSGAMLAGLETQILLVYEGKGHLSSDVHRKVIESVKDPDSPAAAALEKLKTTALAARRALLSGDHDLLAATMEHNNALQKSLHPGITTPRLERIEALGKERGARAAMINGAGGGGSICLLCEPGRTIEAAAALRAEGFRILPFSICPRPAEAWVARP